MVFRCVFFFNDTATTEIYTLSLHDALPISGSRAGPDCSGRSRRNAAPRLAAARRPARTSRRQYVRTTVRSEEHTSELQSRQYLVCRLLLEKKKKSTVILYTFLPTTSRLIYT